MEGSLLTIEHIENLMGKFTGRLNDLKVRVFDYQRLGKPLESFIHA